MPTISKAIVDSDLRTRTFDAIDIANTPNFFKVNDRQFGCIMTDMNGVERYVRIGAIVAEEREDMTARELMQTEINKYTTSQAKKAEQAQRRKEKAEKDKAKREAAKEKEGV